MESAAKEPNMVTLSPQLDFGDDAFVSIGFRLCRFLFNWISAMPFSPHLDFGDDLFTSIRFRR
jgi:hypothetical protein